MRPPYRGWNVFKGAPSSKVSLSRGIYSLEYTHLQVHPFASLISEVSPSCQRLLINREAVGEAENKWDEDGFRFETG